MKKKIEIGERTFSLESGLLAKQADGAVMVRYGDTMVLVSVTAGKELEEPPSFLPLTVDYREHTSAAGKFPGGFFKREGRPSEKEILTSRLIDRTIRPLFPKDLFIPIQVSALVFSADGENDPDIPSVIGASAALSISSLPFQGPIGAVRVGYVNKSFILNPTSSRLEESELDLVVVGKSDSLLMLEGKATFLPEEIILDGIAFAQKELGKILEMQEEFQGKKMSLPIKSDIKKNFDSFVRERLKKIYQYPGKEEREGFYNSIFGELKETFSEEEEKNLKKEFERSLQKNIRESILREKKRLDGRGEKEIRPISSQIGLLPRTHGSALFTRGQTQALALVTLGTKMDEQRVEGLLEETRKRFMVHYNFPSFSVGEVRPSRGPGRREIGHGVLAEKSLSLVIPPEEKFPYTIRIVSDILESNGSSSMATVCAGSLALMDAGVPLSEHTAGLSIGLIQEGPDYILLSDIAGEEDHFGDLDLKIAGTKRGITAIQMDVKTDSLTFETLKKAFEQSKEGREEILEKMNGVISSPRKDLSTFAPTIINCHVPQEKIGLVIGPGGRTIRKITKETGAEINIDDEGLVQIISTDKEKGEKALQTVQGLTTEVKVGDTYLGKAVKILPFGAVVEILPGQEGLLHISELKNGYVKQVEDVLKVGDDILVKVIKTEPGGKISLSHKQALPQGLPKN